MNSGLAKGHRERLRDRYKRAGLESLAEHEVLELLLTFAIPRRDVKLSAKLLLVKFGSLSNVLDAPTDQLELVDGIGPAAAHFLGVLRDVMGLYLKERAITQPSPLPNLLDVWRLRLGAESKEIFEVAYLDSSGRLMPEGIEKLQEGTFDRAAVYPREVMRRALLRGATHLVVAHNHPNDHASPSEQDKLVTRQLLLAAEAVGIKLVDHLIITRNGGFSFSENGLL